MRLFVLLKVALQSIRKNTLRTALTMLGIIIGVAAVIVMVAVGLGAKERIHQQIQNLGTNMVVLTPGTSTQGGVSQGAGSFNRLTVADAEALQREATHLIAVSPIIFAGAHVQGGSGNWRTAVNGVSLDYPVIRDWRVVSGSFFDPADLRAARKVAVLGATVARQLFPDQDPVGQEVQIRNVPFKVIGVLAEKGQTATGADQDDVVLAPYTTVQTRLAGRQFIPQILAATASPADIPTAMEEIRAIMRERHRLAAWEDDDFTVRNQADLAAAAQGTTEVMTLLLAAIASISLLVGGIGIMNIMLVSVTERTREIGIRKALGARRIDLMSQFLLEAVTVSLTGGGLGIILGVGTIWTFNYVAAKFPNIGFEAKIEMWPILLSFSVSVLVGVFFGWYPARKAARLDPIEALRYE